MYGAALTQNARKILLLGSGELGKEIVIEAQRLGVETVAVDRYENAPAMHVAHRAHVIDMLNSEQLRDVIYRERPDIIVPEIEAISTSTLVELEQEGFHVVPTANATRLTMDREGIRRLASEQLGLRTARYEFANSLEEMRTAASAIGFPCVIKPLMSSSGKGQSTCRAERDIEVCWNEAVAGGRVQNSRVIVEQFIPFLSEITLLTVRSVSGTVFCPPIGHRQESGDYIESWQPHAMSEAELQAAQGIARTITDALGGYGVFGVELFLADDGVYFSEVSPRPHDTGLVTLITQDLSEFALHVRAILGFPVDEITLLTPGASHAVKADDEFSAYQIDGVKEALSIPRTQIRLFGKPVTKVGRRMAVALSSSTDVEAAKENAMKAANHLRILHS